MLKIIYHGSNNIIKTPLFELCRNNNDFGYGFYCTEELQSAKEWGVNLNTLGYANCYTIDCTDLSILDLNSSEYTILNWLTILLENRYFETSSELAILAKQYLLENFKVNYEKYDIISGYRADNSYFSYAQDFIKGTISLRQLNNAVHRDNHGLQFVLKSRTAFNKLKYIGFEKANKEDLYECKTTRDLHSRRAYLDAESNRISSEDLFIVQFLREEIKSDDPRIRQNIS